MPEQNDNFKRVLFIVTGIAFLLIALMIFIPRSSQDENSSQTNKNSDGSYTLSVIDGEKVAFSTVKLAIAQSAVDGSGTLEESICDELGLIAKQFDSNANWFSSCSYSLQGSTSSTSNFNTMKLTDGDYCATFTTDTDDNNLTNYEFTEDNCIGYRISIE